jgi:hypothetical protein
MRYRIGKIFAALVIGVVLLSVGAVAAVPMLRHAAWGVVEHSGSAACLAGRSPGTLRNRRVRVRTSRRRTPARSPRAG